MTRTTPSVSLRSVSDVQGARVAVVSVPVPAGSAPVMGIQGADCQAVPVAWAPGADGQPGPVRHALVMGIADRPLGQCEVLAPTLDAGRIVGVTAGGYAQSTIGDTAQGAQSKTGNWSGPTWEVVTVSERKTGFVMNEVNELVIHHDGRKIGLMMGLKLDLKPGVRWWDFVTVEEVWSGPVARAVRAAGYVGVREVNDDNVCDPKRYNHGEFFHLHNWVFAEVFVVMFRNGLVQVTARHINNRFFDQGESLKGLVPIVGIRAEGMVEQTQRLDGSRMDFAIGRSHLDLSRSSDLFGVEHPGLIGPAHGMTVVQPYEGVEMLLGDGEPDPVWNLRAGDHGMWKGMARSFGFDVSMADAPIRTARYLVPEAYNAAHGAYWADAVLPASAPWLEPVIDRLAKHFNYGKIPHRFYEGSGLSDGEYGHVGFRLAYHTGSPEFYRAAVHHAYAMADLGVDHTDFTIRISGMKQNSIAMPLQRINVMLTGWLETADPYLLRVARSVADAAYAMDHSNWPRRSYGRDAAYIRSLTRMFTVTGEQLYLRRAKDACLRAASVQRPEGCFADQGGCYGAHGHLSQIIKPWMGCILTHALCEFVDVAGPQPEIEAAVLRYADWLMTVHATDKDGLYWPYQIAWGDNEVPPFYKYQPNAKPEKHPVGEMHLDYMARVMLFAASRRGDRRFIDAWRAAFKRNFEVKGSSSSVYSGTRTIEDGLFHEAHLWNGRVVDGALVFNPAKGLIDEGREAVVQLPDGSRVGVRYSGGNVELKPV